MNRINLATLAIFVGVLNPLTASGQTREVSPGSMSVAVLVGVNSYVTSADRWAEPFDAMPFPLGANFQHHLADHLAVGVTVMFDQWRDYLGMYAGKWTFRLFTPSLDVAYNFQPTSRASLDVFGGASLGYSLLSVGNELGNEYRGKLKSEPHLAPFIGVRLRFGENPSNFWDRLGVILKVSWSAVGNFSGVYGAVGATFMIK